MKQTLLMIACSLSLSCAGDAERLTVAPLPKDGTALPIKDVLSRLSAQTTTAKEEHFLNQWDGLVEATVSLEQSTGYLLRAPDVPAVHRPAYEKASAELKIQIVKLRESARRKDQTESLESIRIIHNQVRDLQDLR